MAIVGKLDPATLARRMAQTKRARNQDRERKAATFLKPAEQAAKKAAEELRQEREEATKTALRRRKVNGRWVSRETQAEAIATANQLEKLGF